MDLNLITVALYSYLLGSLPFGLILTRIFLHKDIRKVGSGNIGTTNVLRTGNKFLALTTLLLDLLKGFVSVFITQLYFESLTTYSALMCFIGHIYPVWLKFKGGKGVATGIGIFIGFSMLLGGIAIVIWLAVAAVFRYSSLAAIITFISAPLLAMSIIDQQHAEFFGFVGILVVVRHHQNILRLVRGEEGKISFSKSPKTAK